MVGREFVPTCCKESPSLGPTAVMGCSGGGAVVGQCFNLIAPMSGCAFQGYSFGGDRRGGGVIIW